MVDHLYNEWFYVSHVLRTQLAKALIKLSSEAAILNEKEHIKINMVGKP